MAHELAPMGVACGVDLVRVPAFQRVAERIGAKWFDVCFTRRELDCGCGIEGLAARFAAKEATAKALGTGLLRGVGFHDIEVLRGDAGQPSLRLNGPAALAAASRGLTQWSVCITHEEGMALAMVVATGERRRSAGGGIDGGKTGSAKPR